MKMYDLVPMEYIQPPLEKEYSAPESSRESICTTDIDGNFEDAAALKYLSATNALIAGLCIGYAMLFITALMVCQIEVASGKEGGSSAARTGLGRKPVASAAPADAGIQLNNMVTNPAS